MVSSFIYTRVKEGAAETAEQMKELLVELVILVENIACPTCDD